jgi:hypothetical protein
VDCPVGGAIFHRSGEEQQAVAACAQRIRQAQAAGQKLPDERVWRAKAACVGIPNCTAYPGHWSSTAERASKNKDGAKNAASIDKNSPAKEKERLAADKKSLAKQKDKLAASKASQAAASEPGRAPVATQPRPANPALAPGGQAQAHPPVPAQAPPAATLAQTDTAAPAAIAADVCERDSKLLDGLAKDDFERLDALQASTPCAPVKTSAQALLVAARDQRAREQACGIQTQELRRLESGGRAALDELSKFEKRLTCEPLRPIVLSLLGQFASPIADPKRRRVALVVGNSAYTTAPFLPSAKRDADAVADVLRKVGFSTVTLALDLPKARFDLALRAFALDADQADWAMVYFAGHGIEVNGSNYLIPTDAALAADRDVEFEAVRLDSLLTAVEGGKGLRIVMLDACRENPFAANLRRRTVTRSIGRGLAMIEPDPGTLVVYAAKHGEIAYDGADGNSPFVNAFVKHISTPGLDIRRLFDLVRDDVIESTGGRQRPFSYGSLSGRQDFFFVAK